MLEERAAELVVVIEELEAQARTDITGTTAVDDARDGGASIEPATEWRAKRDQHLFAGEHACVGFDEHAFGREIEADARDAAEIVLANDLARDEDSTAESFAVHFSAENDAHRYLRFRRQRVSTAISRRQQTECGRRADLKASERDRATTCVKRSAFLA
jgi:hypothetical protein